MLGKSFAVCCNGSKRNSAGWIQSSHAGRREADQGARWKVILQRDSSCSVLFYLPKVKALQHAETVLEKNFLIQPSENPVRAALVTCRSTDF